MSNILPLLCSMTVAIETQYFPGNLVKNLAMF